MLTIAPPPPLPLARASSGAAPSSTTVQQDAAAVCSDVRGMLDVLAPDAVPWLALLRGAASDGGGLRQQHDDRRAALSPPGGPHTQPVAVEYSSRLVVTGAPARRAVLSALLARLREGDGWDVAPALLSPSATVRDDDAAMHEPSESVFAFRSETDEGGSGGSGSGGARMLAHVAPSGVLRITQRLDEAVV